ncbi:MAG TPA: ferrochelatase [Terriglobales bacterium]|nr:ferrochelatase [Terriglobales bacterium]
MPSGRKVAVLLLAHGSPDSAEEIPEFLRQVTGGRPMPPQVIEEVKHRYGLIGRSPLTELTLKQAELLARELGLPVYVGMRNWKPYVAEAVKAMTGDGIEHAVAICLAPQNSRTSVGLYRAALVSQSGLGFRFDFVEEWHDHPLLIRAFTERLCTGWSAACAAAGTKLPVIFTAHSVPQRTIAEGDPYEAQAKETAMLVAHGAGLAPADWKFAFQSQGMSGGAWLGPTVEETILGLGAQGHGGIFVQPIGFLCDHVEVLYDIDIGFRQFAEKQGMRLWRAESLNDSPLLTAALAGLARARLERAGSLQTSGLSE